MREKNRLNKGVLKSTGMKAGVENETE